MFGTGSSLKTCIWFNNEAAPPTATLSPLPVEVLWDQNQTLNLFALFLPHAATEFFNLMCNDIPEDV